MEPTYAGSLKTRRTSVVLDHGLDAGAWAASQRSTPGGFKVELREGVDR